MKAHKKEPIAESMPGNLAVILMGICHQSMPGPSSPAEGHKRARSASWALDQLILKWMLPG